MLVHVIADFGHGDLAFAEVVQRLKLHLPEAEPVTTAVPPFATLAAGMCVAQLGLNEAPPGTLVFHNVAPRADDLSPRHDNDGERLAYALLPTGVRVVGVNAGYAFSFVKDAAKELRYVRVGSAGSQFRSRDLFARALAEVARGDPGALAGELPAAQVPDVPEGRVAYVDGFGNLKTTLLSAAGTGGTRLRLRIGGVSHLAIASGGAFSVPEGSLAFAPGSSGWPTPAGSLAWMEIFLRGGSAWELFGRPGIGEAVLVEQVVNATGSED